MGSTESSVTLNLLTETLTGSGSPTKSIGSSHGVRFRFNPRTASQYFARSLSLTIAQVTVSSDLNSAGITEV